MKKIWVGLVLIEFIAIISYGFYETRGFREVLKQMESQEYKEGIASIDNDFEYDMKLISSCLSSTSDEGKYKCLKEAAKVISTPSGAFLMSTYYARFKIENPTDNSMDASIASSIDRAWGFIKKNQHIYKVMARAAEAKKSSRIISFIHPSMNVCNEEERQLKMIKDAEINFRDPKFNESFNSKILRLGRGLR